MDDPPAGDTTGYLPEHLADKPHLLDLTLQCKDGVTLKCHKALLAAVSDYFERRLYQPNPEAPGTGDPSLVDVSAFDEKTVRTVLDYVYKGTMAKAGQMCVETLAQVVVFADAHQMTTKFLRDADTCLAVRLGAVRQPQQLAALALTVIHVANELCSRADLQGFSWCYEYVLLNFERILQDGATRNQVLQLPGAVLCLLLKDSGLCINEDSLFSLVAEVGMLRLDPDRMDMCAALFNHLRLGRLSKGKLQTIPPGHPLIDQQRFKAAMDGKPEGIDAKCRQVPAAPINGKAVEHIQVALPDRLDPASLVTYEQTGIIAVSADHRTVESDVTVNVLADCHSSVMVCQPVTDGREPPPSSRQCSNVAAELGRLVVRRSLGLPCRLVRWRCRVPDNCPESFQVALGAVCFGGSRTQRVCWISVGLSQSVTAPYSVGLINAQSLSQNDPIFTTPVPIMRPGCEASVCFHTTTGRLELVVETPKRLIPAVNLEEELGSEPEGARGAVEEFQKEGEGWVRRTMPPLNPGADFDLSGCFGLHVRVRMGRVELLGCDIAF